MQVDSITSLVGAQTYASPDTGAARQKSASQNNAPTPESLATQAAKQEPAKQNLDEVVSSIKDAIKGSNIELEFSKDQESGAIVVKWVDSVSGEAINQIPTETALHLAAALGKLQGQLFSRTA